MAFSWESLAEQQIRQAYAEGAFEALPGFGQPIPGIDEPLDEMWWLKSKLKREELSVLPPALAIRADLFRTLEQLNLLSDETNVRQALAELNERIRKANFAAVGGPATTTMPLDIEEEVAQWRSRR